VAWMSCRAVEGTPPSALGECCANLGTARWPACRAFQCPLQVSGGRGSVRCLTSQEVPRAGEA